MVLLREILELQRQLGQSECLQDVREQEVFRSLVDQSKTTQLEKQLKQMGEKRPQMGTFMHPKLNVLSRKYSRLLLK